LFFKHLPFLTRYLAGKAPVPSLHFAVVIETVTSYLEPARQTAISVSPIPGISFPLCGGVESDFLTCNEWA
jgi:hypothetical protein